MNKSKWISIISCLLILGAGVGGAYGIHRISEQQLDDKPGLAVTSGTKKADSVVTTADAKPKSRKEIIEETQKRVVTIESDAGLGSGFLYNNQGDLLTNAHVVAGSAKVKVRTVDKEEFEGTVIGISTDTDIAVVRVSQLKDTKPLPIPRDHKAEIGDEILALGSPLGLENTVTTGIISGVGRNFDIDPYIYSNMYQISAPITHGNSGGPLVDATSGEVLGINSAVSEEGGIGFSIPIYTVLKMVEGWSKEPMAALPGVKGVNHTSAAVDNLTLSSQGAEDLVKYYYESISRGDFVTAYALLGSSWQEKSSYEDFRKGFYNTKNVTIDKISSSEEKDGEVQVHIRITADERKNGQIVSRAYRMEYTIGQENEQLKILHGDGKKVK